MQSSNQYDFHPAFNYAPLSRHLLEVRQLSSGELQVDIVGKSRRRLMGEYPSGELQVDVGDQERRRFKGQYPLSAIDAMLIAQMMFGMQHVQNFDIDAFITFHNLSELFVHV